MKESAVLKSPRVKGSVAFSKLTRGLRGLQDTISDTSDGSVVTKDDSEATDDVAVIGKRNDSNALGGTLKE